MWPFKKSRKTAKPYAETLEERMELVEAALRSLKTEWLDTYDKLYRLAGRLDAGRRWAGEREAAPGITAGEKAPGNGPEAPVVDLGTVKGPPTAKMSRSELLASWKP